MKVAVIGVGMMGRNHARIYSALPDVELVAVADTNEAAAVAVARQHRSHPYTDYIRMLDEQQPAAVTISVPTVDHLEVALKVIERGIHLLIEKPIAYQIEDAQQIITSAEAAGVHLTVGHIERFNPAVIALKARILNGELGQVFQIDVKRLGPFPARVKDVGVVIDLAVHDLDIMRYISGSEVVRVFAETERRIHSDQEDLLSGLVRLADGTVGTLIMNWLTPTKVRQLSVVGEMGMFHVNYLTQDLYFYENATIQHNGSWDAMSLLRGVSEGRMIRYVIAKKEPLQAELETFLHAVRGEGEVAVAGQDALTALKLAQALVSSGIENRVIRL